MSKYSVWVTLVGDFEGTYTEAFDYMMDMISDREGLEISSHEIINEGEEEDGSA